MQQTRSPWRIGATLVAALVAVTACGSGDGDVAVVDDTTVDETTIDETDDRADPVPTVALDDAPAAGAPERLLAAFSDLGAGRGFRTRASTAVTLRLPGLGVDNVGAIDPDRPTSIMEVAPNDDWHATFDLGPAIAAMAPDPAAAAELDSVGFEIWRTASTMVVDTTGYQPLADLGVDLGPFAPGVASVDLDRLGEVGGEELIEAIAGTQIIDPIQLAVTLPASLTNVTLDDDERVFRAESSHASVIEAFGNDVETVALGAAAGIAQVTGLDAQALAAIYVQVYEETLSEVEITIGDDGVLESLRTRVDLSAVYELMLEPDTGLDIPDADVTMLAPLFDGAELINEELVRFELDDSITVEPPTGDLEDRTDQWLEFAQVNGLI